MKNLLMFASAMMLLSCNPTPTPSPDSTAPKEVWKTQVTTDGRANSIRPVFSGNTVVFSSNKLTSDESLVFLNRTTGVKEGSWNDYQNTTSINHINDVNGENIYTNNGAMVVSLGSRNYGIDVKTKATLWRNKVSDAAEEPISGIGNTIFQVKYTKTAAGNLPTFAKGNLLTGNWQTVFTDTIQTDFSPSFDKIVPTVDTNGDTLLYATSTYYKFPPANLSKAYIYCYNLTKNRLVYKTPIYPNLIQGWSIASPTVVGDKIYVRFGSRFVCLAIKTGQILWDKEITGNNNNFTEIVVADGKVLVGNLNNNLYCYDATTGSEIWTIPDASTNSAEGFSYLNGVLYYCFGALFAVDVEKGTFIWKNYNTPDSDSGVYFSHLRIDPETKKIYAFDYKYARCFEPTR